MECTHLESVPVKEVFNGKTVWEGVVEVFKLDDHRQANTAYAWIHQTDDPANPKRHVTAFHIPGGIPNSSGPVLNSQELRANADIEAEA